MKKIRLTLEDIKVKVAEFYDAKVWHFITLNALLIENDKIEIQWMFSKYESLEDIVVYYVEVERDVEIPSIEEIVPSATISQREIVDMFGIKIENSEKGLYLDKDSIEMPLGCAI